MRTVLSLRLGPAGSVTTRLKTGDYLICLHLPRGWIAAADGTGVISGWTCLTQPVRATGSRVIIRLAQPAPAGAGGRR
jgi:hypothetical protein